MANPRVYRHDIRCPDCGSNRMRKDGFSKRWVFQWQAGLQRRQLERYRAGVGYSAPAVLGWVKKGAARFEPVAGTELATDGRRGGAAAGGSGDDSL